MATSPSVIVFDVNETLSDMSPRAQRFEDIGALAQLAKLWFATLLRDGFALNAAGASRPFADLVSEALRTVLHGVDLDRDIDAAVDHVMSGFTDLAVHPDVPDGIRALRASGRRLVTLTNGSTRVSEELLGDAGIRDQFEGCCQSRTPGRGSRPAPPTSTPRKPAEPTGRHAAGRRAPVGHRRRRTRRPAHRVDQPRRHALPRLLHPTDAARYRDHRHRRSAALTVRR